MYSDLINICAYDYRLGISNTADTPKWSLV